jgi:hypothetical protein
VLFRVQHSDSGYNHRVDTYRAVTDRREYCGSLRFHVPTFFRRPDIKLSTARAQQVPRAVKVSRHQVVSSNQMHASSNLPSMRTKRVGTLVTTLYIYIYIYTMT